MHINTKLQLLSSTRITSGVSFESIVKLNKRYSAVFEKMTLGFECEIAVGNLDLSNEEGGPIDIDTLREGFNESFEFSEQSFLNTVEPEDIIQNFEVEPKYGPLPVDMEADIDTVITDINKQPFAIAYGKDKTLMFSPNVVSISNMRDFTYDNNYNVNAREAMQIGMRVKKILDNFINTYKIDEGVESRVNTPFGSLDKAREELTLYLLQTLQYIKTDKPQVVEENSPDDVKDKVNSLKRFVWMIGYNIDRTLYTLRRIIGSYDNNGIMIVKTDTGAITCVNINHYGEQGLLSPYITFNKDAFKDYYETEMSNERDRQWESELEEAQSQSNESSSGPVNAIHRIVVDQVDEEAELAEDYHSDKFNKGRVTVVEPDSSITPAGAEVVSRVYTGPTEALEWLEKVFTMIDDYDMETNSSTGLHVNIGTFKPIDTSYRGQPGYIDVVKLAILSGDDYLLRQFKRENNTYAKPMLGDLNKLAESATVNFRDEKFIDIVTELNVHFIASHSDRYRTINIANLNRHNYLEFRIAGNRNYHSDMNKVKKAIYRYMQLCAIASDPQAYFKEYVRELYRYFGPEEEAPTKQPLPKNPEEAINTIRQWNSNSKIYRNLFSLTSITNMITQNQDIDTLELMEELIAPIKPISILNGKITFPVLYSIRMLLLYSARKKPNPKQFLINILKNNTEDMLEAKLGFLYLRKPAYVKYLFTGQSSSKPQIESSDMSVNDKISILSKTRVDAARLVYYSNRSTPQVVKTGEKAKPKAGYGKVVKTRKATKEEEAQLKKGKWIRTRVDNKKPTDPGAKKSKYRPHLGKT